ncbi:site-specific integrase [Roseibium album]|uniref:site-specific integrase n=1 Tax=Roseibium album TaxID=311410 RepID=UPI0024927EC5|nr:site-specific integrase [Roseibium album]
MRSWGFDPDWYGAESDDDPEAIGRDMMAEHVVRDYPVDDNGNPIGVKPEHTQIVRVLRQGASLETPPPTLADVKKLYLKERVQNDTKKQNETNRVFRLVFEVLSPTRRLDGIRRQDAKDVRDHMMDGRTASSVDRYLNIVRAAFNYAITEFDIEGTKNPFLGLHGIKNEGEGPNSRSRKPFNGEQLLAARTQVLGTCNKDAQRIWRILEKTGCRIAEVSGLRRTDVHLEGQIPYIDVEWHEGRRLKTKASRRWVPLVGDALAAAKDAHKASEGSPFLFPDFCTENGASSVSNILSRAVRAAVDDRKVTTHSLRHRIKDLLRLSGAPSTEHGLVLGQTTGHVSEDYGGDEARLEVAHRMLKAALELADREGR